MNYYSKRFFIIKLSIIIVSILILSRFFYIQVLKNSFFSEYAKKEYKRKKIEIMPRGIIYDINGNILATSIVKWDVVIMKKEFQGELTLLAKTLSMSPEVIRKKFEKGKNYIKIKKGIEKDEYDKIKELNLKGIVLEPHQSRTYPADVAREIIGLSNENNGLSQIELKYDKYLKGNIIESEFVKDLKGNIIKFIDKKSQDIPQDLYLTIDLDIQSIVEQVISNYYQKLSPEKIIVMIQDIETGFISAMASYPQNFVNLIPIEYVYEPGSTFKTIVLATGFEEELINENDIIDCENGAWKINQKYTVTDHEPLKKETLINVYAHSSNIGFGKTGLKIGIDKLYPYIKKFGFGTKYTELSGESYGIIKDFKNYRETDLITTSYGYGIAITPIQLINGYTSIANNGILLKPQLVYKIGDEIVAKKEEIRRVISEKTSQRVEKMMIEVVEKGTGINAQIEGLWVAGKTGTANKLDLKTKKYIKGQNVTSFCGFFPASKPKYTILVIVDNSKKFKYGGQTSAPIFSEIAKRILSIKNIKQDREIDYTKIKEKAKINILN